MFHLLIKKTRNYWGFNLLLQHTVSNISVPRTKTLPGTQTNSAKEHGEIAQQCSQSKTFEDLKIQRTNFIQMFRVQKQD